MNVSDLNAIADRTDSDRSEIRTADPESRSSRHGLCRLDHGVRVADVGNAGRDQFDRS